MYRFEVISDNPTPARRLLSLGGRLILLDIEASPPSETPVQVSLQLASYDDPSNELHSFLSKSANPNINSIILQALQRPRLDQFARIFSFLACADRIYSETEFNVFPALDEISHVLFNIHEAQQPRFADQSSSWYGLPELNATDMVGTGLWFWQSHRHSYRALERKIDHHLQHHANMYRSLSTTASSKLTHESYEPSDDHGDGQNNDTTRFHDPFTHGNITSTSGEQASMSAQAAAAAAEARAQADRTLMKELTGIGNKEAPYYFQRYMLRLLVRPFGDTAIKHVEHLDPPPISGGLDSFINNNESFGKGGKYGIRYSTTWLPDMVHFKEETGLVDNWGPEPEQRPMNSVGGELVLMLEPPVFLPYHVATQMDAVSDTIPQSYLSAAFVTSQRRIYGPKKHGNGSSASGNANAAEKNKEKENGTASSTTESVSNIPQNGSVGETSIKPEEKPKNDHAVEEGTSVLLGNGYAHGTSNNKRETDSACDDDTLDLDISFTSLVPYSFVRVVEIPMAHPRDLPGIILNLRKAILIDTLCRSLNLHETVQDANVDAAGGIGLRGASAGNRPVPGVGRNKGALDSKVPGMRPASTQVSSKTGGENEEEDEALDSDLLLLDTLLEAANNLSHKHIASQFQAGTTDNANDPSTASGEVNVTEKKLLVNISLVEENDDVHITVSLPALNQLSFWITPQLKSEGVLGIQASHLEFSSQGSNPNGGASNEMVIDDEPEVDVEELATKISAALELTEDLGLVCRYLSRTLCKSKAV